jgi:hypothetical protein
MTPRWLLLGNLSYEEELGSENVKTFVIAGDSLREERLGKRHSTAYKV